MQTKVIDVSAWQPTIEADKYMRHLKTQKKIEEEKK